MPTKPLTWTNIIGYGLGDVANNFAFAMGALFLLNYYTDVAGIGAAAAGTMLLLVRVFDAFMDVVAGRIVDRTTTRWGRFRPFLLWGAIPLLILSVLVFSVPAGWGASDKLVYAYVSYALLGTAYSFVNIPYGSLATVMTQQPTERARLGASRMLLAAATFCFLALIIGPKIRGATADLQSMFTQYTLMFGTAGLVLYFLCFKTTREVVERSVASPKLGESVRTLRKNPPLLLLCLAALCVLGAFFSMNASAMFFARYVLGDPKQFVMIVVATSLVGTLLSAPMVPMLVARIGKKGTFLVGTALGSVGFFALFLVAGSSPVWVFGAFGVAGVGTMMASTVMWALEADTVEYGEWATGVRIEGLTYAFFSFTRKCGQAIGGSVPAFLLAGSGYVPNAAVQSEAARDSILVAITLVPAGGLALGCLLMCFYPLTDRRFLELLAEIKARRRAPSNQPTVPATAPADDSALPSRS